jgi:hypothetical protein
MIPIFLEICYAVCFMTIHCHRQSSETCLGKAFYFLTLSVLTIGNASDRQLLLISADENEL